MANAKKTQIVDSIVSKITQNPNFILFLFEKTSHKKLEDLRKKIFEVGENAKIQIVKNTLFKVAAKKTLKKQDIIEDKDLKGSSALLTLPKDWYAGLSSFYKFAKEDGTLSFKVGVLDSIFYKKEDLLKIAKLPSKAELVGKLLSTMKAPQLKTVMSMKFPMIRFINILKNKN